MVREWYCGEQGEWRSFTPPGPPVNLTYLVHRGLVYEWTPLSESPEDAVRSARALRGRASKLW